MPCGHILPITILVNDHPNPMQPHSQELLSLTLLLVQSTSSLQPSSSSPSDVDPFIHYDGKSLEDSKCASSSHRTSFASIHGND